MTYHNISTFFFAPGISKRELSDIQYYRDLLRQLKRNMARNGGKNNENTDHNDDVAIYDAKNGIYF